MVRYPSILSQAWIHISLKEIMGMFDLCPELPCHYWEHVQGKTLAELAPNLFSAIPKKVVQRHTVSQAFDNRRWVCDIKGALTVQVLSKYLQKRIWKSWAPMNCRFFIWLAINNKCWTSDRLAKRGMPHQPACPFCDQAEETINHILVGCVLSMEVWTWILRELRLDVIPPPNSSSRFCSWWSRAAATLDNNLKKGFNSLVILVAWMLWRHRNACVFDGATSSASSSISSGH
ncbi:hypothetical protein U9M48_004072 [Paspalum notatum var. saurae]|uniref:Reverse transcriptase zinc-binding domain-containing protein n=1 Tax=Paspalum notatum var. saurae TaxID=547442 RepID=A0AAQ3SHF0_PASNO